VEFVCTFLDDECVLFLPYAAMHACMQFRLHFQPRAAGAASDSREEIFSLFADADADEAV